MALSLEVNGRIGCQARRRVSGFILRQERKIDMMRNGRRVKEISGKYRLETTWASCRTKHISKSSEAERKNESLNGIGQATHKIAREVLHSRREDITKEPRKRQAPKRPGVFS